MTGRKIVPALIRAYQQHPALNWLVRHLVSLHHVLARPTTRPCPLAGSCSVTGLAQAEVLGWAALPLIASRMALCGPALGKQPYYPSDEACKRER